MSRVGSTITESDSKILNGLFNPYQWYTPTVKPLPRFDDLVKLGVGGKLQQGQQSMQQEQMQQQPLQQQQQPQQEQVQQYQQQPIQQQFQQEQIQPQQMQYQPIQQQMQPQQEQVQQYQQQPIQQQMKPQAQQQQMKLQQYQAQPIQQAVFEQPQGFAQFSEVPLGLQFSELPGTVYFEIRKGKKGYEQQKHKGKRIPISEYESSRVVSIQQGNLSDWQMEARNCIDKILQLNNKGYNRINQLENFKFNQGFSNQVEVNNWILRLKRNLDTLVKENERLRAELDSGNFGKMGGVQNQGVMQGGVNLGKTFSESVDSSSVIRPSEIKKVHYSSEKIGQWHPQEKHSFTERVKDTAIGIATTAENVALHPIDSVGKLASAVEQVALHPIQSVEKAADAVVHTVM